MAQPGDHQADRARSAAEAVLTQAFGGEVRLGERSTPQEPAYVLRFAVRSAPAGAPTSVIVKVAREQEGQGYDPDRAEPLTPAWRLFNDWAGLEFLSLLSPTSPLAPRFYGGDRALGLLVEEDLGAQVDAQPLLLGQDATASEEELIELARSLGQLHASTIGNKAAYDQVLQSLSTDMADARLSYGWLRDVLGESSRALDLAPRKGAWSELEHLIAMLENPGPYLAYNHGDPCPGNWVRAEAGLRLFDFEYGGFRHALLDGVYGRILFPTCWCVNRLPERVPLRMESTYRSELIRGCPDAADDQEYRKATVDTCVTWLLWMLSLHRISDLLGRDVAWGISTVRQRLLVRAEIVAGLARECGHLESIGETIAEMAAKLRARWPAEVDAMPLYPAFR